MTVDLVQAVTGDVQGKKAQGKPLNASDRSVDPESANPVLESSKWTLKELDLVRLNEDGIKRAAKYIHAQMQRESYVPRTWRTHPLHICPEEPFSWSSRSTHSCLNWIFFISTLNFSFWSELEGSPQRYGVEWREGWGSDRQKVHTGYWSLVAAVDRALEEGVPLTDPRFYSSKERCPDSFLEHIFRPAKQSTETIPLLPERISALREVGEILCDNYNGSFYEFVQAFRRRYKDRGTALQLVEMITETFPAFRDEHMLNGRRVYIWKRAQILVAESWAAFHPPSAADPHPLFPTGAAIHELTMFADYRVPQIMHHLRIISYPPTLVELLRSHTPLASGSAAELSIRAASIVGVECVRREILAIVAEEDGTAAEEIVSSVLIDFYLWDLAKRLEDEDKDVTGLDTDMMLPIHRTRSIWY